MEEDATGWLYCVQNPRPGRGWRTAVLNLEKAAGTHVLIEQQDLPPDSELEGLVLLPEDRLLFLTSEKTDNARLGRLHGSH